MYARITNYKMKPESIDAAMALLEQLKPQILALPGMVRFINAHDETGAGYVISLVDSKETADANADAVQAIWANFADHLESIPSPQGSGVIADWTR